MNKFVGVGVVVIWSACATEQATVGVEAEIARLEAELASHPGELVVTRSSDMPFSPELEEQLATAGKVIHIDANERVTAYVGLAQEHLPEGVPPRRTFMEHGGDIIIAEQDLLAEYLVQREQPEGVAHAAALVIGDGKQWPESTVAYTINANVTGADRTAVINAIASWNVAVDAGFTQLKVRFVPRYWDDRRPYVDFVAGGIPPEACGASEVGRKDHIFSNWYSHSIHFNPGCFTERTIHHEMGHTAGLWHEHQRCDRDNFVNVPMGGVNCERRCGGDTSDFGPYNYLSVMHYGYHPVGRPDLNCGMTQRVPASPFHRGQPWQAGSATRLDINDVQGLNQSYIMRPGLPPIGPGRFYSFVPVNTTKVLAIPAGSTGNNVGTILFDRVGGVLDQHYSLHPIGEGFVQIRPRHAPNKCLEPMNFGGGNGVPVVQFDCDGVTSQHWIVAPNAWDTTRIDVVNRLSGKSLDLAGGSTVNGTPFQQWDHGIANNNQRFTLSPAF
jgi:hypothetical protein